MIIDGKATSTKLKAALKQEVEDLFKKTDDRPKLTCVIVGNNPASEVYVKNKIKSCEEVGINSSVIRYSEDISEADLLNKINKLNQSNIDGFIVQLPLPKHINEQHIIEAINPLKDVDGFTPINLGKVMLGEDCFTPATPLGIIDLLKAYSINTEGKNVLVIGRSNIVGKPIANILMNKPYNANVTVMHSRSGQDNINKAVEEADIIIVAVGQPKFLKTCSQNATIIDVGINRIEGKLIGDVDFDLLKDKAKYITPVPGGVGPMTVCSLMKNTVKAFKSKLSQ